MRSRIATLVALLALAAVPASRAQVIEVSPFLVAPFLPPFVTNSIDVAAGSDGGMLFAWDEGTTYHYRGNHITDPSSMLLVRPYAFDGAPLAGALRIDTTGGVSSSVGVGRNGDGYLTAWQSVRAANNDRGYNVYLNGRRVNALGIPTTFEFRVDPDVDAIKFEPHIAGLTSGNSVVVYYYTGSLRARLFDPQGAPIGDPFTVTTLNAYWEHDVTGLANGDFVVGWSTYPSSVSLVQIFAPDGSPRSAPIDVGPNLLVHDLDANPMGGFAVIGKPANSKQLWLRYLDDNGVLLTGDILVHERVTQYYVSNETLDFGYDGSLLVQWFDYTPQSFGNLFGRSFDPNLQPMSGETETAPAEGIRLQSARLLNGNIVNFWTHFSEKSANVVSICDPAAGECSEPGSTPASTPSPTRTIPPVPTATPVNNCGNGKIDDEAEECDDGNRISGDGCDSRCLIEECGNGRVEGLEECDDGNGKDGDGCQNDCTETPTHDSVIFPVKPLDVSLRPNRLEVIKSLTLKVYNADVSPVRELPGHLIQIVADDGSCPAGTIQGRPDFNRKVEGDQDTLLIAGGSRGKARVSIRVTPESFANLDRKVPQRCLLTFTAVAIAGGSFDPTPENNSVTVELNVFAGSNDLVSPPQGAELPEFAIASVKPAKASIGSGKSGTTARVRFAVVAAGVPADAAHRQIDVSADDGNCPPGTVGDISIGGLAQSTVFVSPGRKARGSLTLHVSEAGMRALSSRVPARCTASLTASSPTLDSGAASHTTSVVIEVKDRNDY